MLKINSIKFLIISFSVALASNDSVLKPMDIFEMEGVSDPQISPDGSKILYVRSGSDIMKDKRYSNIWIINFDGAIIVQLPVEKMVTVNLAGLQMVSK